MGHLKYLMKNTINYTLKKTNKVFTVVGSRSHMSVETEKYLEELKKKMG